jgi:hypothetical protein
MKKNINNKDITIISLVIITFLIIIGISSSLISDMRINDGDVRSIKDLKCYWTIYQNSDVNVTWYRDGTQNLTATVSCTSGVECYTSVGSGTVPNSYTKKDEIWTCSVSYWNGTNIETKNTSATIDNTPPTTPEIYWSNGTRIINTTAIVPEDNTTYLDVNATDEDNDTITYNINDTTFCSISSSSGAITCNPTSESQLGVRIIKVYADDSDGGNIYDFLTINVTPTNDAPAFSPTLSAKNLTEGQIFNYVIQGIDDENNVPLNLSIYNITPYYLNLTISRINNTAFMLMLGNNRTATNSEVRNNYTYTVTLTLADTDNITNNSKNVTSNFQLHSITFNHLPNISYYVYNSTNLTQGGNLSIYINATDIDNQTLTFSISNPSLYNITYSSTTDFNTTVLNASFAYAWINITGLTNNHVITHNFTLYVFDTSENNTKPMGVFITNTNDPPTINEMSNYTTNTLNNINISDMIAYRGVLFRYRVNASDIDDQTYDYLNTGLGTYNTSDSVSFPINQSTGLISFTPDTIGNFTFNVTVMDNSGSTYNITANIEVLNNTNPIFTLNNITIQCYEYDTYNSPQNCYYNISANVTENDSGDYITEYWTNSTIFQINNITGIINFTANQSDVGNYSIMLNVTDSRGGINSTIIYLTISNTNNPPVMGTPDVPLENMIVGVPYQIIYDATDLDLSLNNTYENLSFTYNITGLTAGANTSIFTFTQLNATRARLSINVINSSYEGNYSINVTVNDSYRNISYHRMIRYIYNATLPPNISRIIPSGTPYNDTINNVTWMNTSYFPNMSTTINIHENETYLFNQTATVDNSSYPNTLTYAWYYDNISVATTQYYLKNFDFFSNGTHNLTTVVRDQYNSSSSFEWIINVTNINRPPTYNPNSLENLTVSGSAFIPNYLTYSDLRRRFYDPDDDPDNLGYSTDNRTTLSFSASLCAYANFSFEQNRMNIHAYEIGECVIRLTAADALNSSLYVNSEFVLINITNISESDNPIEVPINIESTGGGTNTRPLPVPLPEEVEKPKPLQILTPKLVTTYKNATIQIPIVVNNTWNDTLIGITLEAETNATNVSLYLDRIYIPKLNKGESTEVTLYVQNYKSEGHYEIRVTGNVSIPAYRDVATIFINSAEMRSEGDELESKISFAKDLLSSNPECQELNELLNQAQLELDNNNYVATAKIVDTVLNGCKYLVNNAKKNEEAPDRDFIKTFEWKKSYGDYLIIGLFGVLFLASLFYILKKDNPAQNF